MIIESFDSTVSRALDKEDPKLEVDMKLQQELELKKWVDYYNKT